MSFNNTGFTCCNFRYFESRNVVFSEAIFYKEVTNELQTFIPNTSDHAYTA